MVNPLSMAIFNSKLFVYQRVHTSRHKWWQSQPAKSANPHESNARCWSASSRNSSCGSAEWAVDLLKIFVATVCPKILYQLVLTYDLFKVVGQNGFHLNYFWPAIYSIQNSYDTSYSTSILDGTYNLPETNKQQPSWAVLPTTFPKTMEVQLPFQILTWWIYRGLRDFFFTGNHGFFQPNMGLSCRKKSTLSTFRFDSSWILSASCQQALHTQNFGTSMKITSLSG